MTSTAELLEQGIAPHRAGRLRYAGELYQEVLARDTAHAAS
jgi:hypothetical protein